MKALVNKKDFVSALSKAVSFIPNSTAGRTSLVYAQAGSNVMKIAVSFPDITFITTCPAECMASSEPVALYGRKFYDIIRQTAHKALIEAAPGQLTVTSDDSKWIERPVQGSMKSLDQTGEVLARIEAQELADAFEGVKYAAGKDTIQPQFHMVDVRDGRVRASNGVNYHEVRTGVKGLTFQISNQHVDSFIKLMKAWSGDVALSEGPNHFFFQHGKDTLAVNKLNADFPDLDRLLIRPLKAQAIYTLKVRKVEAENAIRRVRLSQSDDFPYIELHMSQGEALFRCVGEDGIEAVSKIEAIWNNNPRIATFNTHRLYDCITHADKEVLEIRFSKDTRDRKSPMIVEGASLWMMVNQLKMRARA